ncbi:MAG: DUF86 domain-containing protein [Armatimonadota bacterium]|nr:DUF86 domain-containing protein [Armatimonadota bacterium]MDR7440105.1 DUF86 domain-containing protein [Armatimonadota bacterium]MDR7563847.1 DUF86 domain-containing protein [Armatimonadota bacterium]MDR7567057.1 DUF86 domain-containing protein [Armatimonadota bacterium]MDR7601522.1 DUF86 domain-containing protein [Armatimonadota bacterium]
MSFLAERISQLRIYLQHLRNLRARGIQTVDLEQNLSLRNDVVHSLLMVAQMVIDVAGELSASAGLTFPDYRGAVENLRRLHFPSDLVDQLALLPGFRNVVVHGYLRLDPSRVLQALETLEPVERFVALVAERYGP